MSVTAADIMDAAALNLGATSIGEPLTTDEYARMLALLNNLIESWSIERLSIFCTTRRTYGLTIGKGEYTIGGSTPELTGSVRPVAISAAAHVVNGLSFKLALISAAEYSDIDDPALASSVSERMYYQNSYPQGVIYLHPVPRVTSSLDIWAWEKLTTFVTKDTAFDMPEGYRLALEWNLAVQAAPMFGRPLSQDVIANAIGSKRAIAGLNQPPSPGVAQEAAVNQPPVQQ